MSDRLKSQKKISSESFKKLIISTFKMLIFYGLPLAFFAIWIPFLTYVPKEYNGKQLQENKILEILLYQDWVYTNNGKFIEKNSDLPKDYLTLTNGYKISIKNHQKKTILILNQDIDSKNYHQKQENFVGVIEIINPRQTSLNSSLKPDSKIRWKSSDVKWIGCKSQEKNMAVPSDREITNMSDRCPAGYIELGRS